MGTGAKKGRIGSYAFAALLGIPGLLTLIEANRLAALPKFRNMKLMEGPVGYMLAIGLSLIGFSLLEIFIRFKNRKKGIESSPPGPFMSMKVWMTIGYMVLFLLLVQVFGFLIASGCFLVGTLHLLGCRPMTIVLTVFLYCGGLYWVTPYMGLSLPRGILGI